MLKNIENNAYKEMIFAILGRFGHKINNTCVKKVESCLDTEKLSDLHLEIADAIIEKKGTNEIEKIINQIIK